METDVSIPNISVGVDRLSRIKVEYQTEEFEIVETEFSGKLARLILQMTDLNNGKTMIQKIHPLRQKSLKKYLWEVKKGVHLPKYELVLEKGEK